MYLRQNLPVIPAYPRFPPPGPSVAVNDLIDLLEKKILYNSNL